MRLRQIIGTVTAAGLVLFSGVPLLRAQQNQPSTQAQRGQLPEKDYKFVTDAARGGMMEVQMGEMARQKGTSPVVRNFGERMVTDHSKANDQLRHIATQKGATPPTQLSHHEQSSMEHLQSASGATFDKDYARQMVKDHKHDVKEFQKAAKDLTDPDLRAFAQNTLPTLEEHLRLAEQMEASVKGEK